MAIDTIKSVAIFDGSVATADIADDAVTAAKISFTAKAAGKETIWVPANSMYPNSTNGCAAIAQTELGNGPELKTLDFDKDSDEFAQFCVAFPKSWNEGTVTFQAFFTANSTNTGDVVWTSASFDGSGDVTGTATIQSGAVESSMLNANVEQ